MILPPGVRRARYVGPLDHLRGETALLRDYDDDTRVLAQFDRLDPSLVSAAGELLCYNWHPFRKDEFEEI